MSIIKRKASTASSTITSRYNEYSDFATRFYEPLPSPAPVKAQDKNFKTFSFKLPTLAWFKRKKSEPIKLDWERTLPFYDLNSERAREMESFNVTVQQANSYNRQNFGSDEKLLAKLEKVRVKRQRFLLNQFRKKLSRILNDRVAPTRLTHTMERCTFTFTDDGKKGVLSVLYRGTCATFESNPINNSVDFLRFIDEVKAYRPEPETIDGPTTLEIALKRQRGRW